MRITGEHVTKDFVWRTIAPLQWHVEPMWMYGGQGDPMRLDTEPLEREIVKEMMSILFTLPTIITLKRDEALSLHRFVPETQDASVGAMPVFDRWGLVPMGHVGAHDNPEFVAYAMPAEDD